MATKTSEKNGATAKAMRLYGMLCKHGYSGELDGFLAQKAALDRAMKEGELPGKHVYSIECGRYYLPSPDAFDGCLFAEPVRQLAREIVATFFGWRIFDRSISKSTIHNLEALLFATDVYYKSNFGNTPEYKALMADRYHRLSDHLPNDVNMWVLKVSQVRLLRSMFLYFSVVAEHEAVRKATGTDGFEVIREQRATLKWDSSKKDYATIYDEYEQCPRMIEDDYIFSDASIFHLMRLIVNPPFEVKTFPIERLRPSRATIDRIMEEQVIGGKGFFDTAMNDPYHLPEWHLNPHYRRQVAKVFKEVSAYAIEGTEGSARERIRRQWAIMAEEPGK